MRLRSPYSLLLLVFGVSRAVYYLLGVRFDARPVTHFFQFLDVELLKHRLLESLYYEHAQQAGFNLYAGIVLKLFPDSYGAAFHAINLALGAAICCLLYYLMRICGVTSALALILTAVFTVSPGVVLFENFVLFEYLVVFLSLTAGAALYLFCRDGKLIHSAAFFTCLGCLVFLRYHFHLVYFVVVFVLLICLSKGRRKNAVLAGSIPLLLIFALYLKNWILFGTFASSTWMGFNIDTITSHQLSREEARDFVERGIISPVSLIDAPAPIRFYRPYVQMPAKTGIPVLDAEETSTGGPNFDNLVYFQVQRYYLRDGLTLLRRYPVVYLRSLERAWFTYFLPTSDFPFFDLNRPRIQGFDRFFNLVFFGQFRDASDRAHLRKIEAKGNKLALIAYTGTFLLIGLPLLWLCSIYYLASGVRKKKLDRPVAILLGFMLLNITYLTAIANFLSCFENNRYRFQIDGFFLILLGVALERLRQRMLRGKAAQEQE